MPCGYRRNTTFEQTSSATDHQYPWNPHRCGQIQQAPRPGLDSAHQSSGDHSDLVELRPEVVAEKLVEIIQVAVRLRMDIRNVQRAMVNAIKGSNLKFLIK